VTLSEAYSGTSLEVPTPSGSVKLKVPPRTQQGTRLRLKGKGVKRGAEQGDLFVEIELRLPDKEDSAVAEALKASEQLYSAPVRRGIAL